MLRSPTNFAGETQMKLKSRGLPGRFNRFRLMLTLGLAVVLPAALLIYMNFRQLHALERDKLIEAAIHRDFQEMLAIAEKKINKKAFTMTEETRNLFPSPDAEPEEKQKHLDLVLARSPWLAHVFLFDEKGFIFRSQPNQLNDPYVRKEHEKMVESYRGWLGMEGKMLVSTMHKKSKPNFYSGFTKRAGGEAFMATALFVLPHLPKERPVLGGASFICVTSKKLSSRKCWRSGGPESRGSGWQQTRHDGLSSRDGHEP